MKTVTDKHIRAGRRLASFAFGALVWVMSSNRVSAQATELISPSGDYRLRIISQSLPQSDPYLGDCTLILSRNNRVLSKRPTTGYLIDALWSPDGRYVAVNNRRGNSGDYVWVFSLRDGRAAKKPDDESTVFSLSKITKIYPDCNEGTFDRDLTIAKAWKSGDELEVEMRWRFYKTALIVRHAVYRISGLKLALIEEQVIRHPVDWQPQEQ